jgi:hypothetical protein
MEFLWLGIINFACMVYSFFPAGFNADMWPGARDVFLSGNM